MSAAPLTTARADDKSKMGPWRLDSGNTATGKIWKGRDPAPEIWEMAPVVRRRREWSNRTA